MTKKRISSLIVSFFAVVLSGCVTQQFENGDTPVVQNQANRDDMAVTRISLGLGYLKMGNMPQAKQNLAKAKTFAPNMVQVYTAYAHYYETVGEHKLTVESFEKALMLKSDDADTLNNYGVYLCRQKQLEAAEQQFLKAIAVPSYLLVAKSYENLSACFLQKDDFIKAEGYLNKAIMHSPSSASTLFQMVTLQYAMADYQQAKVFGQRFEKVTRRFTPQSLALSYKVNWKLGQRRTAKNYGTMLVKMYPQSWEAQQYLLNELELIAADSLAKRYQLTQVSEISTKSKKRVVKLSPRKMLPSNGVNSSRLVESKVKSQATIAVVAASELSATNTTLASSSISTASSALINAALILKSDEKVKPILQDKQATVSMVPAKTNVQETPATVSMVAAKTNVQETPATVSMVAAKANVQETPATVSKVLAKTSVQETLATISMVPAKTNVQETPATVSKVAAKANGQETPATISMVAAKTNVQETLATVNTVSAQASVQEKQATVSKVTAKTGGQEKRVVVLAASKTAENKIVKTLAAPSEIDAIIDERLSTDTKTEVAELIEQELPLEDQEIFHIAQRPAPIIEDAPKVKELLVVVSTETKQTSAVNNKLPELHVVSVGDTLYGISIKYNIKIKALRRWNNLAGNKKIRINDKLYLVDPKTVTE